MTDPRDADAIRDSFLLTLRGEFEAIDQRVVTAPRTPLFILGTALSLELEGAESEAFAARQEAFPDTASDAGVLRHAELSNLTRGVAARAVVRAAITGAGSSGAIAAGKTVTGPTGLVYLVNETAWTLSGGAGFLSLTARDGGADSNVVAGEEFTWQNGAPLGLGPTLTAAPAPGDGSHMLIVGADEEPVDALRERAVYFRKSKAQAGNRADWVANIQAVEGIGDAMVYPRAYHNPRAGTFTPGVPGTLVAFPLAPSPPDASYVQNPDGSLGLGLDPTYSREPSDALIARVQAYIEGTQDAAGRPVPSPLQVQRHSAGIGSENYTIAAPSVQVVNVTVAIAADPAIAPWPWGIGNPPARAVQASLAPTTTSFTLDFVTGIRAGSRLAVNLTVPGPAVTPIRFGYWLAVVQTVVGNTVTLTAPLPIAPPVGADVRPDCGLWADARRLCGGILDHLGTGDETNVKSQRFPRPADSAPDRLFTSRFIDALQELPGVSGVSVQLPATPYVAPPPTILLVPGFFRIIPQV